MDVNVTEQLEECQDESDPVPHVSQMTNEQVQEAVERLQCIQELMDEANAQMKSVQEMERFTVDDLIRHSERSRELMYEMRKYCTTRQ
jgi:hypothetical protein